MARARLQYVVLLSIFAAVATIGLKGTAYWVTGSVGLLSDAMESGINLLAALTAFASLWYSSRPVDPSHTYGHEKIEYFSSGLEGILILVAAVGIAWYAIRRLLVPEPLHALDVGTLIAVAASFINLAVAQVLLRVGRATGSIVLEADGRHLMADVWTSVAIVVGIGLVWLTGYEWLDPVLALLVAANILWTAHDLVRRSFNGLMDHALPEAEQAVVRAAVEAQLRPDMDYHALRTRQAGPHRFVDFHLLVPGALSVQEAHDFAERIEASVRTALPGTEVVIHIEPIEARAAWEDNALVAFEPATRHPQPKDGEPTP
jgi:cation diffusion facilitator family transporter